MGIHQLTPTTGTTPGRRCAPGADHVTARQFPVFATRPPSRPPSMSTSQPSGDTPPRRPARQDSAERRRPRRRCGGSRRRPARGTDPDDSVALGDRPIKARQAADGHDAHRHSGRGCDGPPDPRGGARGGDGRRSAGHITRGHPASSIRAGRMPAGRGRAPASGMEDLRQPQLLGQRPQRARPPAVDSALGVKRRHPRARWACTSVIVLAITLAGCSGRRSRTSQRAQAPGKVSPRPRRPSARRWRSTACRPRWSTAHTHGLLDPGIGESSKLNANIDADIVVVGVPGELLRCRSCPGAPSTCQDLRIAAARARRRSVAG